MPPACSAPGSRTMRRRRSTSSSARPIRPAASRSASRRPGSTRAGFDSTCGRCPTADGRNQPAGGIRVSQKRRSTGLHDEPAELRRQQLLLAEGADFLGRQRRDAAGLHARLPAQRVPHQEGVRVRSSARARPTGRATATARSSARCRPIRCSGSSWRAPSPPTCFSDTRSPDRPSSAGRRLTPGTPASASRSRISSASARFSARRAG